MDTYHDLFQASEPEDTQQPDSGKKQSPFADSPYVSSFDTSEPHEQPRKKKSHSRGGRVLLSAALILALVLSSCSVTALLVNRHWEEKTDLLSQAMDNRIRALQEQIDALDSISVPGGSVSPETGMMTPGQVYAQNVQAVVAISNQATTTNIYGQISETASSGSGFIISQDGYVVSNYHVVEGAKALHVLTWDGQEYEAELIGFDATNDISLLKIQAEGLPYVTVGSSDELAVGDQVAAIGNPLGELTSTLTVGYVSAKDRMVTTDGTAINMLQTDAAINSGNSGGPLFNMKGQVVGITTAKYSGTSSSGASIEGIGFAIPMDDVVGMIQDLKDYGYVTGAYLGVMVRDVEKAVQAYGLPAGAYVIEVTDGYAAQKAGIRAQDIIVNLGGYDVTCLNDLSRALRKLEAGQTTTVTVYRGGQQVHLSITLDEKPVETTVTDPTQETTLPSQEDLWEDFFKDFFG